MMIPLPLQKSTDEAREKMSSEMMDKALYVASIISGMDFSLQDATLDMVKAILYADRSKMQESTIAGANSQIMSMLGHGGHVSSRTSPERVEKELSEK